MRSSPQRSFALASWRSNTTMFNSPPHYCTLCRTYVELDQSQPECAREYGCTLDACPLKASFCGQPPSSSIAGPVQEPASIIAPKPDVE